jgi:methylase of polypeptide subunit release factors
MEFSEFELTGLKVFYRANENGGGMHFGQDYVQIVRERYGVLNTIYEFCSGPAFIGFSLLNSGLCNRLILSDIHTPVAESVEKTITENGLKNVKFFNMSGVSELPESDIDLVVSNPPHFSEHKNWLQKLENRIYLDVT